MSKMFNTLQINDRKLDQHKITKDADISPARLTRTSEQRIHNISMHMYAQSENLEIYKVKISKDLLIGRDVNTIAECKIFK